MKLANCPYCKRKMSYLSALLHKTDGEYVCSRCERESNLYIKKRLFTLFGITMAVALIILICYLSFGNAESLLGIFLVSIPFIIFFFITPFFIRLVPLKKYKKEVTEKIPVVPAQNIPSIEDEYVKTTTRVIPSIGTDADYEEKTAIDKDVFNAIKAERRKLEKSIEDSVSKNKEAERKAAQKMSFSDEITSSSKKETDGLSDDDDVKIYRR